MAVDLDAIRKRLAQLNGSNKGGKSVWKPAEGEYMIRVVPWVDPATKKSIPLKEISYYNNIGRPDSRGNGPFPMPTLHQYGKPDPIDELIRELRQDAETNKPLLKLLYPKLSVFIPIIVRKKEDEGVRLWVIKQHQQELYQKFLGYFVDAAVLEDVDEFTDPDKGFDIKVTVSPSGRFWAGKPVLQQSIELARKPSRLSADPDLAAKWLSSIPNPEDIDPVVTYDDMKKRVDEWLAADPTKPKEDAGEAERGGKATAEKPSDSVDLEKIKNEINESKPAAKAKVEASTPPAEEDEKPKVKAPKKDAPAKATPVADVGDDLGQMLADLEQGN